MHTHSLTHTQLKGPLLSHTHAGPDVQARCWIKEASPKGQARGEWGDQREEDTRKGVGGGGGNGDCGATTEQGLATGAEQEECFICGHHYWQENFHFPS